MRKTKFIIAILLISLVPFLFAGCQLSDPNTLYIGYIDGDLQKEIAHNLLMEHNLQLYWGEDVYYGTIDNWIVLNGSLGGGLCAISTRNIAGYNFFWPYYVLRIYVYRDGEVYELEEAYEEGLLSKEQIGVIHARHEELGYKYQE